jgi:hypothetical protein
MYPVYMPAPNAPAPKANAANVFLGFRRTADNAPDNLGDT